MSICTDISAAITTYKMKSLDKKICDEYEANINTYLGKIGYNAADPNKGQNNNASEFYTSLTVLTSALKVCTKMEQVVVKAVSTMLKLIK